MKGIKQKEIIHITENETKQTFVEKINKTKSQDFEKINNIDKSQKRLIRKIQIIQMKDSGMKEMI